MSVTNGAPRRSPARAWKLSGRGRGALSPSYRWELAPSHHQVQIGFEIGDRQRSDENLIAKRDRGRAATPAPFDGWRRDRWFGRGIGRGRIQEEMDSMHTGGEEISSERFHSRTWAAMPIRL